MSKTFDFILKNILHHEEFRRGRFIFHPVNIRLGIGRIFPENVKNPDFSADQSPHHPQAVKFSHSPPERGQRGVFGNGERTHPLPLSGGDF